MRQTTVLTLLPAAIMSVALFFLKYEVTDLEEEFFRYSFHEQLRYSIVPNERIHAFDWSQIAVPIKRDPL